MLLSKRWAFACAPVLFLLLSASPARADWVEMYGLVYGGGGFGSGLAGEQKDADFFDAASGGNWGFQVGAEVVFLDGWVEHNQYFNGDGIKGTWTQFMLGFDVEFDLGAAEEDQEPRTFGIFGAGVGFGVGTPQQVDLPLNDAQVSDKGLVGQVTVGAAYRIKPWMHAIVLVPVAYSFMWKGAINDSAEQYHSFHTNALLGLKFQVGL